MECVKVWANGEREVALRGGVCEVYLFGYVSNLRKM